MHLDEAAIARCFDGATFARGKECARSRRVVNSEWDSEAGMIFSEVTGTELLPYEQETALWRERGRLRINGTCTCPVGKNCKHVAAAVLRIAQDEPWIEVPDEEGFDLSDPLVSVQPSFPADLARWLSNVEERLLPEPELPPNADEVRYIVRIGSPEHPDRYAAVDLLTTRLAKNAVPGKRNHISMNAIRSNNLPKFIRRVDLSLIKGISRNLTTADYETASFRLEGVEGMRYLEAMLETGRCRWGALDGPVLRLGEVREAAAEWKVNRNGKQSFDLRVPNGVLLPTTPLFYVDHRTGECGPVDTGLPSDVALALLRAPDVLPEFAGMVRTELARYFPNRPDLLPVEQQATIDASTPPTPVLHVSRQLVPYDAGYGWRDGARTYLVPIATLKFEYGGYAAIGTSDIRRKQPDGTLRIIQRRLEEERTAERRLYAAGWKSGQYLYGWRFNRDQQKALVMVPESPNAAGETQTQAFFEFLANYLPVLRQQGWKIEIEDEPQALPPEAIEWQIAAKPEGNDWFDLDLGLIVDGEKIELRPILLQALGLLLRGGKARRIEDVPDSDRIYHQLPDGRILTLPVSRLKPLVQSLVELFGPVAEWSAELRLPSQRAAELATLDDAASGGAFSVDLPEKLRELSQRLASFERITPFPPPASLKGELRPYQADGLSWLQFLREYGFAGILADDMGLGKTVQTLSHILAEKEAGRLDRPVLIVAPTSTMPNWRHECERFAPSLRVLTLQGLGRAKHFPEISENDIVLTTYPLLTRDKEALNAHEYHLVVLDEAQNIKNPVTSAAKAACALRTRHRLCLSGTPVENNLDELWSLLHFLMPGLLGGLTEFRRTFRSPIENHGDKAVRERLSRRIRPFILRRTKEQVATELPPKTEVVERVELAGPQRELYETLRLAMDKRVRDLIAGQGLERSRIEILDALLKLRQACCDPRLVKLDSAKEVKGSAKLDRLMEMLEELRGEGKRVLLFSQFTSMLDLIEKRLREAEWNWVRISGDTQDRETPVKRFQAGEVPLFLISLKAGGTGLNLTAADTVIHYDPWWNPAVERQATDRAHRIGQEKSVFVFKLVAAGTVEDKILELQERKARLAGSLFDENAAAAAALTADDLKWVFE
ncbi:DEAD/DEAH box helicase [Fimbriimonas ginsengisoli]|uniref:SNF2 family DNA/RNA helicase n=1 Tax=Fimbriimonas ginsengisoli Gsoil 348 TaxID=661478 RepID=A0A068NNX2_FIMGI|nr:DEAD/DEAH box helicase [Fimbriimonas ginsengisoli]AIE85131.1 SNF2 family DNA/RNA helicase [Fimbriimonas ginsengisoli Gsoil 348]